MKYRVIYREAGDQTPKQIVMTGFGEAFVKAECEAKGWQVLLIQNAGSKRDMRCLYAAAPFTRRIDRSFGLWVFGLLALIILGIGVWAICKPDCRYTPEAVKEYKAKAGAGDSESQRRLGICLAIGKGVEKDGAEAVRWLRKALEHGDAKARCCLGWCYANGEGVAQDWDEAAKLFRSAAEQGNVLAQINLGWCYENGLGVVKDEPESAKWYKKAMAGNLAVVIGYWTLKNRGNLGCLMIVMVIGGALGWLFLMGYPPIWVVLKLQAKHSWGYRLLCRWVPVLGPVAILALIVALADLVVLFVRTVDLLSLAKIGWSQQDVLFWFVLTSSLLLAILMVVECLFLRKLLKWWRTGRSEECMHLTFAQYVKIQIADIMSFVFLLAYGIAVARLVGVVPAALVALSAIALGIYEFPTRKKFDKIVNGSRRRSL